jgi:DUF3017 family protein
MTSRGGRLRRRSVVGDWLFGSCVLVLLVGLAMTAAGQWRQGCGLCSLGLLFAAWTRIVLPDGMAGMLRVRRKSVDVVALTLFGAALLVLAIIAPRR